MKIKQLERLGLWLARTFGTPRKMETVLFMKGSINAPNQGTAEAQEMGCTCGVGDDMSMEKFRKCPIHYLPFTQKVYVRLGRSAPVMDDGKEFMDGLVEAMKAAQ